MIENPVRLSRKSSESAGERAAALVVRFGRALHRFGAAADEVEQAMSDLSRQLGLHGELFVLPTSIHAAFGPPGRQHVILVRLPASGDVDLGRLAQLHALAIELAASRMSIDRATARLRSILDAPPHHGALPVAIAFALVSAAGARMLDGGLAEIVLAAALGFCVGVGVLVLGGRRRVAPVLPALAAFGVATIAGLAAAAGLTPAPWTITLAALMVLLPGLTLTLAMHEVATGHLAAGAARLVGVASTFLALACGIAFGDAIATSVVSVGSLAIDRRTATPLPDATVLVAIGVAALAFTVLFQARFRDLPWILLGCVAATIGTRMGAALLDARLAPLFGALALGIASNLVARATHRPTVLVALPGLLLLVPGSLGARSLSALLADDAVGGVQTAFAMAFVAAALVSGLLLANLIAPARGVTPPDRRRG